MIKIKQLSFAYGKNRVFSNFDISIPEGQVCLITGINGVGKSTLLRLIAGVLKPDRGEILFDPKLGPEPRRKIGFISDVLSLYQSMTVAQSIYFQQSIYSLSSFDDSLIRHTKIGYRQKVRDLSVGQRTILLLSLILSIEPQIILIDEIIHSMDAYLRKVFLEHIVNILSKRRITLIMVNLNFHDIEYIVNRVVLLKSGQIVVDEYIDNLKKKVKKIVSKNRPESMNILYQIDYSNISEYYIYPFSAALADRSIGKIVDLNLTEIVSAFIGGEYVQEGKL